MINFIGAVILITAAFFISSGIKGCITTYQTKRAENILQKIKNKLPKEVDDAATNIAMLYTIDFIQHRPDLIENEVLTAAASRLPFSTQKKEFKIPETVNPYKVIQIEDFPEYLAYEALENLHTILARHHYSDDVLLKMVSLGILKGIVIAEKDYMPGVALKIYEAEGHLNDMLLKYF